MSETFVQKGITWFGKEWTWDAKIVNLSSVECGSPAPVFEM
jgi:hypothetical protein